MYMVMNVLYMCCAYVQCSTRIPYYAYICILLVCVCTYILYVHMYTHTFYTVLTPLKTTKAASPKSNCY